MPRLSGFPSSVTRLSPSMTTQSSLAHEATMAAAGPYTFAHMRLALVSLSLAEAARVSSDRTGSHCSHTAIDHCPIGMSWAS